MQTIGLVGRPVFRMQPMLLFFLSITGGKSRKTENTSQTWNNRTFIDNGIAYPAAPFLLLLVASLAKFGCKPIVSGHFTIVNIYTEFRLLRFSTLSKCLPDTDKLLFFHVPNVKMAICMVPDLARLAFLLFSHLFCYDVVVGSVAVRRTECHSFYYGL